MMLSESTRGKEMRMEKWKLIRLDIYKKAILRKMSIHILLSIKAALDYEIWKMDFKTRFLIYYLEESIYMMQLAGYIAKGNKYKVCNLLRSIYGLKQASRSRNQRFGQVIKNFGFHQNVDKPCVYKHLEDGNVVFPILYVDEIVLVGNDVWTLSSVKLW
ncbi:gag/pol protein [Gossypium australe]|uniref:Gag/pol protein n=1 Tax=Gossypium australe TaxID=47621 RepID=A0A5B6WQE9_9ROSI|nr:gag/pol protein [Gossypium australe]